MARVQFFKKSVGFVDVGHNGQCVIHVSDVIERRELVFCFQILKTEKWNSCCHGLLSGLFCAILTHRVLDLLEKDVILRAENIVANLSENSFKYETNFPYRFELVFLYCGIKVKYITDKTRPDQNRTEHFISTRMYELFFSSSK